MLHGQLACLSKESLYAGDDSQVGVETVTLVFSCYWKKRPRVPRGEVGGGGGGMPSQPYTFLVTECDPSFSHRHVTSYYHI